MVLLGPRALAPAQEDTLIMRGDVGQGQRGPCLLEAEPVLVFPGLTLTMALAHAEDECGLLLVDLRGGIGEVGPGPQEGDRPSLPPTLEPWHSQKTSPRG